MIAAGTSGCAQQRQHRVLPRHTRTHLLLWTPSLCHSQRAVGCSRAGCGFWTWPRGQEGREIYRGGLASPLGDAIGSRIWPVGLSVNLSWPLYCLVAKHRTRERELYREWVRERRGWTSSLMFFFCLLQQQNLLCARPTRTVAKMIQSSLVVRKHNNKTAKLDFHNKDGKPAILDFLFFVINGKSM